MRKLIRVGVISSLRFDQSGGVLKPLAFALGGFALFLAVFWFMYRDDERFAVALNFFERGNPEIIQSRMPPGVGATPAEFEFLVRDEGAGLDEVIVRTEQEGDVREVMQKRYPTAKLSDRISFKVDGKELGLSEGDFVLKGR